LTDADRDRPALTIGIVAGEASGDALGADLIRAVRARRNAVTAAGSLDRLEEAAGGSENLLPRILDCVEADVTVGEISGRLRRVWGEYREAVTM